MPLATPKLYNQGSWEDGLAGLTHAYNKYCKPQGREAYGFGTSMGANVLALILGHTGNECPLKAATCIQGPQEMLANIAPFTQSAYGFWEWFLGKNVTKVYMAHEPYLREPFKEKYNIDIRAFAQLPSSYFNCDEMLVAP